MRKIYAIKRKINNIFNNGFLRQSWSIVEKTVRGFVNDDCLIMAAAVSFYALLSLIPFLFMIFSIAGYVLNQLGPDYANQKELFGQLVTYIQAVVPFLEEDIIEHLRAVITNRQTYGVTGLIFLLVTSGLVFRSLELAFAKIFRNQVRRSIVVSQLLFVLFLFAMGLAFMLFYHLGVLLSVVYSAIDEHFHEKLQFLTQKHAVIRVLITLVVATTVFVMLIKYYSRQKTRFIFVLEGGIVFSLLWMVAVRVFGYYLEHIARFSLLYGSLATLAIIVVWIFYSVSILLLCAEFTYVLESEKAWVNKSTDIQT